MTLTQINKAGLDEIALDHVFTIGASGSSAYTFQGEGLNGTVNNPTLYLTRGKTYRFENGSGGHPIRIQSTSGASGTAYNTGVTNNAGSGTVIVEVQHDAPDVLYYQCTSHAAMNGILYITGALADGGVTTAKIADNAVTTAKIANDAVTTAKIADNAVTTNQIASQTIGSGDLANGAVTTTQLNDAAVTTAKIADNAVTTAKIGSEQIVASNIAGGTITAGKLASGVTDLVSDTSPQLGGDLDTNSHHIALDDSHAVRFGANNDLEIYHDSTDTYITNDTGDLYINNIGTNSDDITIKAKDNVSIRVQSNESAIECFGDGSVDLYYDGTKRFETLSNGAQVQGRLAVGDDTAPETTFQVTATAAGAVYPMLLKNRTNGNAAVGMRFIATGADLSDGDFASIEAGHGAVGSTNHEFRFKTCSGGTVAEKLRIQAGGGISFNGDSAAANALDDYEEGTWSPQIYYQNGGDQSDSTNLAQYGWYQKVGNVVHVSFFLRWSLSGSAANDNIGVKNFPFIQSPVTSTYGDAGGVGSISHSGTSLNVTDCIVLKAAGSGSTLMYMEDIGAQGNRGDEFGANNAMRVWGSVTYRTT